MTIAKTLASLFVVLVVGLLGGAGLSQCGSAGALEAGKIGMAKAPDLEVQARCREQAGGPTVPRGATAPPPPPEVQPEAPRHSLGALTLALIADWQRSWERCDAEAHGRHYWADARIERVSVRYWRGVRREERTLLTRDELRRRTERLCARYTRVTLDIGEPELISANEVHIEVRFRQEFHGFRNRRQLYGDAGWKTLRITRRGEEVRIAFETWHSYETPVIRLASY